MRFEQNGDLEQQSSDRQHQVDGRVSLGRIFHQTLEREHIQSEHGSELHDSRPSQAETPEDLYRMHDQAWERYIVGNSTCLSWEETQESDR